MDKQVEETLGKALRIINTLLTNKQRITDWNKEKLLSAATQLSGYSFYLAPWMADLKTDANFLDIAAKEEEIRVYLEERGKGTTQKDSEILAKQASLELQKEAVSKRGQSDKIRGVLDKSGEFVTIVQTNIRQAKNGVHES